MRFALSLGLGPVFALLAAGCAGAPEPAPSSESEVVANSATNVAGRPATSEDGKSVYWVDSRSLGARLMRIDMAEPLRSQPEAQLGAAKTNVDRFEARGAWLFYSGTVLDGTSVVGQIQIGQAPWRFQLPKAAHVSSGDVAATKSGLFAFIARGSTTSQLYVFDGSTQRMVSDLVWSSSGPNQQLVESNDGKSLLFYDRAEGKARTITSSVEGPVVSTAINAAAFGEIVSYDGRYLLWNKDGDLSNVDLTNGRQTFYVERTYGVWVHGPRILYVTGDGTGQYILNTAPRDGLSPDSELAYSRSMFGTKVSDDGATLFFWPLRRSEPSAPPLALMRAPLDASAPPVATLTASDAGAIAMDLADQQGGVFLVRISGRPGANQELRRLDAATGETLETMPWPRSDRGVALSGDGSTIYASTACQVGAASGTSVVRVASGVGRELIPCQLGAPGSFLPVPHSTNVLHLPATGDSFQLLTPTVH